jgi:hypothetical protein
MDRNLGKKKMKANESAPMPTKGRKGANFHNQTTEVPKNRFPWTLIIAIIAFIILIAVVVTFLEVGSTGD